MTGKELKNLFKKEHNIGDNFNIKLFFIVIKKINNNYLYYS